jgi:hypothetical protein
VDNGNRQLHVACYMLLLKALYPGLFYFLRGTHESPMENQLAPCKQSFLEACQETYPDTDELNLVWEMFNSALMRLPVAAVVDGECFCAPGGLATELLDLNQFRSLCQKQEQHRCFDTKDPNVNKIFNELAGNHLDCRSTGDVSFDRHKLSRCAVCYSHIVSHFV